MGGVNRAECLNRERGERDGGGEEKIPDLCGAVQNAADELDQLLHVVDWLTGQEVLLVGCVEDDDRGHRHLAEKQGDRKRQLFNLLNLSSGSGCRYQSASLDGNKLWFLKEQMVTQYGDKQTLCAQSNLTFPMGLLSKRGFFPLFFFKRGKRRCSLAYFSVAFLLSFMQRVCNSGALWV